MADPCAGASWQRATASARATWAGENRPCALCHQRIDYWLQHPHPRALTVDHIVPRWAGGAPLDPANWQPAHRSCNSSRGATEGNRLRKPTRTSLTW